MQFLILLMNIRSPLLDRIMLGISHVGTPYFLIGLLVVLFLNSDKKTTRIVLFSFLISQMLCQGLKIVFQIPRPWILESDTDIFRPVSIAVASATGYSFPSIHSQSTASVMESAIHFGKSRKLKIAAWILLILVPFSRLYLGCHTLQDVLAGIAVATVCNLVIWYMWGKAPQHQGYDALFTFLVSGFALVLIFLAAALVRNGSEEYRYAADAVKTGGLAIGFAAAYFFDQRFLHFRTEGSLSAKVIRACIAFGGFIAVTKLLGLSGANAVVDASRYFLGSFWMFGITPLIAVKCGLMSREP